MKRFIVIRLLAAALFTLGLAQSAVGATVWSIDAHHSSITFSIDHLRAAVPGALLDFQGKIIFDPADLAGSVFDLHILVDSVNTRIRQRDRHLRSADFFDACKYPVVHFVTDSIQAGKAEGQFIAQGKLSVKGQIRDFTVPFTFHPTVPDPLNKGRGVAGITARFSLDRLELGVGSGRFHKMGLIGRKVDVAVNLEIVP